MILIGSGSSNVDPILQKIFDVQKSKLMNLNDFIGLEVKLEGKVGEVNPNGSVVLEEKPWKATHNGCQYPTMVYRNVSNFDEIAEQLKKDDWVKGIGKITEVREFIPLASGDFLSFGI